MASASSSAARSQGTRLEIIARTTPELIERVCRVIRHRGARIERLVAQAQADGTTALSITLSETRDADLLARQAARLPDVSFATVMVSERAGAAPG